MCVTIAISTTLTSFPLLKEQVYSSLKILNILRKMVCEGRRMVQNLFYFRRLNTSVCTLHAYYKRCVLAWNIRVYVMYVQLSNLRKSGPSDSKRFHADGWLEIYEEATSRFSKLFQMRLKFLPSQRTQCFSTVKTNQRVLYEEPIAVHCRNQAKQIHYVAKM